jgi:hypothetical protein
MTKGETARLEGCGNRIRVTFSRELLTSAGFLAGDRLRVEAEPGRLALRRRDERTAELEAWWARFAHRYRRTLHDLAK